MSSISATVDHLKKKTSQERETAQCWSVIAVGSVMHTADPSSRTFSYTWEQLRVSVHGAVMGSVLGSVKASVMRSVRLLVMVSVMQFVLGSVMGLVRED